MIQGKVHVVSTLGAVMRISRACANVRLTVFGFAHAGLVSDRIHLTVNPNPSTSARGLPKLAPGLRRLG